MSFVRNLRILMNTTTGGDPSGAGATPPAPPPAGAPSTPPNAAGEGKPKEDGVETISMPKSAFDERVAKATTAGQRALLKELGFDRPEDAKTAIAALKKLEDEKKTATERLEGRVKELEPKAARADSLARQFESLVKVEFEKLPEQVREAIDKVADGDAEKRWAQIEIFRAAGMLGAAPVGPAAPKTTAPATGAAPPPAGGGPKTKFQEWNELREKSPTAASVFFQLHGAAIEASRPAGQ